MKAVIYSTPACGYCKMAKTLLEKKGIDYEEFMLGTDITKNELIETIGQDVRSVPQILIDNKYVAGYTELSKFLG